jgi:predicted choloylglycine hydrolase
MRRVPVRFDAIEELEPGPRWAAEFEARWPVYREWYLRDGEAARPSYLQAARLLRRHMPELGPTYERLVGLAGGGDLVARALSLVDPPPYLGACSQGVWTRDVPVLVRNYDYLASRLDGLIWSTAWTGRRVIGTGDSLWGLLDGLNEDGLAVSLTFGGRRLVGRGFGIPLVVRYLLETCATVLEAEATLTRLPVHLAHNLTLVDRSGRFATAYLAPDRAPVIVRTPVATNHQHVVDWPEYAAVTRSHEREAIIAALLDDPALTADGFAAAFLVPPLLDSAGVGHFGTLYTAVFRPTEGVVDYRWPGFAWRQSFEAFEPGSHVVLLAGGSAEAALGSPG